jgi:hypothetical protein
MIFFRSDILADSVGAPDWSANMVASCGETYVVFRAKEYMLQRTGRNCIAFTGLS